MNEITEFSFTANQLQINWHDGQISKLDALWLRDHCQMPQSRDPNNGQRLLNITDFSSDTYLLDVQIIENGLRLKFGPETHQSDYSFQWLQKNCYCLNAPFDNRSAASKLLWQADHFDNGLPRCDYADFCRPSKAKQSALQSVKDAGFVLLHNVPCIEGQVLEVIKQFGFVRTTNYGALFEVREQIDANNLAFTNLGLGCHLDNPYRDPVPSLQLLHCLLSSTEGGESILQDGFKAAAVLKQENTAHFELLSKYAINYRFQDPHTDLHSYVPMIETNLNGEVIKVRFNNRSISTLKLPSSMMRDFYTAYRHYAEILQREALQVHFKLQAGELMLFDNTRVLHGRKAYQKGGQRHLQGAYSDLDGLYSTLDTLAA